MTPQLLPPYHWKIGTVMFVSILFLKRIDEWMIGNTSNFILTNPNMFATFCILENDWNWPHNPPPPPLFQSHKWFTNPEKTAVAVLLILINTNTIIFFHEFHFNKFLISVWKPKRAEVSFPKQSVSK